MRTRQRVSPRRSSRRVSLVLALLVSAGAPLIPLAAPAAAATCGGGAGSDIDSDINGDGRGDVVVTERGRTRLQGGIHVLYGTPTGLTGEPAGDAPDDQFLTPSSPGVPGSSEDADDWGGALAVGDFDGDRCADVAVGAPGEDEAAGAVTVLYGSPTGLVTAGSTRRPLLVSQDSAGVPGPAEPNDRFGAALAAADLDGDGRSDLAVGAPGESVGEAFQAGVVDVLFGSAKGLGAGRAPTELRQGRGPVGGAAESDDGFGAALAAGRFAGPATGGAADSLAVGAPGENGGEGAVSIVAGGPAGPTGAQASRLTFTRGSAGLPGSAARGDAFGAALAAGDFRGDGSSDLAIGVPGEAARRGGVTVVYSAGAAALSGAGAQHWTQSSAGIAGTAGPGDGFGAALATGRLTRGKTLDLAIGAPADDIGSIAAAGSVHVLPGSPAGLRAEGSRLLHQDVADMPGTAATGDSFGRAMITRQIDGKGPATLVVGAPGDGAAGTATQRAGSFTVLGASAKGPKAAGAALWTLESPGVSGSAAPGVFLGYALG